MSKSNNLSDFLTDIASAIREKGGTSALINAQAFADSIRNLPSGGGGGDWEYELAMGTCSLISTRAFGDVSGYLTWGQQWRTSLASSGVSYLYLSELTKLNPLKEIYAPNAIGIGNGLTANAFSSCYSLEKVNMSNFIYIGGACFANCYSLSQIITNNLCSVGESAFLNCSNLSYINLSRCYFISNSAFAGCSKLFSSSVCDLRGITTFYSNGFTGFSGAYHFKGCVQMKSVLFYSDFSYISASCTRPFYGCSNLEISFDQPNLYFFSCVNPFFDDTIGDRVTLNCPNLMTANNLISISGKISYGINYYENAGDSNYIAFLGNSVSSNLYQHHISNATIFTNGLSSIPISLCSVPIEIYDDTSTIVTVSPSQTVLRGFNIGVLYLPNCQYIGDRAFSNIYSQQVLPSIYLPNIKFLGENAFCFSSASPGLIKDGCLQTISINGNSKFFLQSAVSSNNFTYDLSGVKFINNSAFGSNKLNSTNTLINCDNVEFIGSRAFAINMYSRTIDFPNVKYIGDYGFGSFSNFSGTLSFPNLIFMGAGAFYGCNKMTSFYAPSYPDNTYYVFPNSLQSPMDSAVPSLAFAACTKLTDIVLGDLSYIPSGMFSNCQNLVNISVGSQVKKICSSAFYGCSSLTTLPSDFFVNVEEIESFAFQNCSRLTGSLELPKCYSIGRSAFNSANFSEIYAPVLSHFETWSSAVDLNNTVCFSRIFKYGSFKSINMPSFINYFFGPQTSMSVPNLEYFNLPMLNEGSQYSAYQNNSMLFNPTYASKISYINLNNMQYLPYFTNLSGLKQLKIDNCVDLKRGIYSCSQLESINLPNCLFLTDGGTGLSFSMNGSLSYFNAPFLSVISINTFYGDTALETVIISDAVSIVWNQAFQNCYALKTISLPNCLTIGSNAFLNCYALESIFLPNCQTISVSAFRNCSSLKELSLPNLVSLTGNSIFSGCYSLSKIYFAKQVSTAIAASNIFASSPIVKSSYLGYFGSIYVPSSTYSYYTTNTYWRYLSSRFVSY